MTDGARYWDEWDEDTGIPWWDHGRRQLNAVIRSVNQWSLDGRPDDQAPALRRRVDMGLQTFAAVDGGGGWADVLREIGAYLDGAR